MKKLAILAVVLCCGVMGVALAMPVMAKNPWSKKTCELLTPGTSEYVAAGCDKETSLGKTAMGIINIVIGVTGIISVLMIVIGGMNFTTSAGDPGKTTKARKTILFSVIGLVVAISAWVLVNFVLKGAS